MWDEAVELGEQHGYRNAQATVLAPTGTIGFMMDCDTTGVEPDIALVKYKKLVGGGLMKIVNQTVPMALAEARLHGAADQGHHRVHRRERDDRGRAAHQGQRTCRCSTARSSRRTACGRSTTWGTSGWSGAVQPFISGAISKTVNVPKDATVEEIQQAYIDSWRLGTKAVSIYRDGSKRTQPLNTSRDKEKTAAVAVEPGPRRRKLPDERHALTHKFDIQGHEGYITVGLFEDGKPGEIFLVMAKEGSTISGLRRRVRAGDQLRAAVRRAAAGPGRQVQPRALRAVRDDQEPGRPLREVDRRLHLPLDGDEVPVAGRAVPRRRQRARGLRRRRRSSWRSTSRRRPQAPAPTAAPSRARSLVRGHAEPGGRAAVLDLRLDHGALGLVLQVRELRHDERLRVRLCGGARRCFLASRFFSSAAVQFRGLDAQSVDPHVDASSDPPAIVSAFRKFIRSTAARTAGPVREQPRRSLGGGGCSPKCACHG